MGAGVWTQALKRTARLLCSDYTAYYIYRQAEAPASDRPDPDVLPIDSQGLAALADPHLAEHAAYAGVDSTAFCLSVGGTPAAVCFFWAGERYRQHSQAFWPLAPGQANLMQIVTSPQARGQGAATRLIAESARRMAAAGWQVLYARVWHSHIASWKAFERAGWRRVALVLEINPWRRKNPWRLRFALGPDP